MSKKSRKTVEIQAATPSFTQFLLPGFAILIVLLAVGVRIRLLDVPLERDEGEYAYVGQLMLQGVPPYRLAANMKLPGTHATYAVIMAIFGQNATGIHIGFLLVNLGTIALVFLLAKRLFDTNAGFIAGAGYALLSLASGIYGTSAHATHFVMLPALGATLLLLDWRDSKRLSRLVFSGLLYGVAFLMKQPGILFAVFGGLYLLWILRPEIRSNTRGVAMRMAIFGAAAALPFLATCLGLWLTGDFASFWFWTVSYGRRYGTISSLSVGARRLANTLPFVIGPNWGIWLIAGAGLALAWLKREMREAAATVTALLIFAFAAVSIGFYFREHYFVMILPGIAVLAGACVALWRPAVWAFAGAAALAIVSQREYLFELDPPQVSRRLYDVNPFPEAARIGEYLNAHTTSEARWRSSARSLKSVSTRGAAPHPAFCTCIRWWSRNPMRCRCRNR